MSDKTTSLIERDRLSELIHATVDPAAAVSANAIPRTLIDKHDGERLALTGAAVEDFDDASVSPVAVLLVLSMLVTVFVAIVRM